MNREDVVVIIIFLGDLLPHKCMKAVSGSHLADRVVRFNTHAVARPSTHSLIVEIRVQRPAAGKEGC